MSRLCALALILLLSTTWLCSCHTAQTQSNSISAAGTESSATTTAKTGPISSSATTESTTADTTQSATSAVTQPQKPELELSLTVKKNPLLHKNLRFSIDEEQKTAVLNISYANYADLSVLTNAVVSASYKNGTVSFSPVDSAGRIDLTQTVLCHLTDTSGNVKTYRVWADRTVHSLPIVNIYLKSGNVDKIDRNATTEMTFSIDCSGAKEYASLSAVSGTIRGRGNSTWKWEKKPYKIKFDEKQTIFGMDDNRDWILLANYADKSLIRNTVAYELGRTLENITWSPHQIPIDLFINGEYRGVYSIGEQMEPAVGRVEIEENSTETDTDYLIEIGGVDDNSKKGIHYFHTKNKLVRFAAYVSPGAKSITQEQKDFIGDYFQKAEDAIMAGEGYEEFIDVDSFVDWILLYELTYNMDGCFHRSCYVVKEKGGKLKMGPIWDFDLAFGNYSSDNRKYDDFITYGKDEEDYDIQYNWCTYLLKDAAFRAKLADRWTEKKADLLNTAESTISYYGTLLEKSQKENFSVWPIWNKRAGYQSSWCSKANSYQKQLQYLRDFLSKRATWLDKNL